MDRFQILKGLSPPLPTSDSIIDNFVSEERNNGVCFQFQDRIVYMTYDEHNEITLDDSYVGTLIRMYDYKGRDIAFNGRYISSSSPIVKTSSMSLTIKRSF